MTTESIKDKIKSLPEKFDRAISGGVWAQVRWFTIAIVSFLLICITIALCSNCSVFESYDNWSKVRGVIYHFFDPGNLSKEQCQPIGIQLFSMFVSFLGMVFLSGMLITTLSNIVQRRVENVERGRVVYKGIKNHYVIIGYGEIAICLINELFKRHGWPENAASLNKEQKNKQLKALPKIIILTSQDIPSVRADLFSQLQADLEKKVFLYAGDIESKEHLSTLNIANAKEIYVLGEPNEYGRDSKNIACMKHLALLRGSLSKNKEVLKVNVQFDRMPSYSNIQKLTIPDNYITYSDNNEIPNLYFRAFNFYENWARLLWSYYKDEKYDSLYFEPTTEDKYVHLVIVGFNRMGRALLLEALRICHYPNFDPKSLRNKTKITVIDKEMASQLPFFQSQYPFIDQQIADIEVEYIDKAVENEDIRTLIDIAARDKNRLLTIAICLKDPDLSLATGLNLPESVYYQPELVKGNKETIEENNIRTRVLIRHELQDGLGEILEKDTDRFKNVKIFGMLTNGISHKLLNDTLPMYIDYNYLLLREHKSFLQHYNDKKLNLNLQESKDGWSKLSETRRWSNRYQVDMFGVYLKLLRENHITDISDVNNMDAHLLEKLASTEHRRWIAERTVAGWRQINSALNEIRMDKMQLHNLFIPYDELPDGEKEKDRSVIQNIIILDSLFGKSS